MRVLIEQLDVARYVVLTGCKISKSDHKEVVTLNRHG